MQGGYAVLPGPFQNHELASIAAAYDAVLATAVPDNVGIGSTSVRVGGVLARVPQLAAIFMHPPLLAAARRHIGGPFKLSSFHARSVRPGASAQRFHQDVAPGRDGWPLLGFIFMIDGFNVENGATRFLPGSHDLAELPPMVAPRHPEERHACGEAGSMIVFDGSTWHGHGANITQNWRRSVQGALIPAGATAAVDHRRSLAPEIWSLIPEAARAVIQGVER